MRSNTRQARCIGVHVRVLVLSEGLCGLQGNYDRSLETYRALRRLGVEDIVQASLPDTRLHTMATELVSVIEAHCKALQPDRVYTMFKDDRHQDHRAVYEASIIACRSVKQILSYETPSSWPNFMPIFSRVLNILWRQNCCVATSCQSSASRLYAGKPNQVWRAVSRSPGGMWT